MAAQIVAGLEAMPTARMPQGQVTPHRRLVQLRPAVRFAANESDGLNGLRHPVVVEIGEPRLPSPSAPRKAERFALVNERGNATLHRLAVARIDERKMALLERKFAGDIADIHIQETITIKVAEIDSH